MLLAGCSQLLGLDSPERMDASISDSPRTDAKPDAARMDSALPATCPQSYSVVTGLSATQYRISAGTFPWDAAATACAADQPMNSSRHTHLAVITTDAERSALSVAISTDAWIGLSDRVTEGTFLWVSGEPTSYPGASGSPWATNEPQSGTNVNCALIVHSSGDFKVQQCPNLRTVICECDDYPNVPANY